MAWPSWTPRAQLARFMQGTTRHCYTKSINYGPHRKDFFKVFVYEAVDTQGLGQFAPKGSTQSIRSCHILYGFRSFFSIIHVATLIAGCGYFCPSGLIGRIYVGDYIRCGPNGFRSRFSKFFPSYMSMGPYLMNHNMKFHHVWQTDISDILLSKCEWMMSDARLLPY